MSLTARPFRNRSKEGSFGVTLANRGHALSFWYGAPNLKKVGRQLSASRLWRRRNADFVDGIWVEMEGELQIVCSNMVLIVFFWRQGEEEETGNCKLIKNITETKLNTTPRWSSVRLVFRLNYFGMVMEILDFLSINIRRSFDMKKVSFIDSWNAPQTLFRIGGVVFNRGNVVGI